MRYKLPTDITEGVFFRSLGPAGSEEMLGAGFLRKAFNGAEFIESDYNHYALIYVINGTGDFTDHLGRKYRLKPGSYFQRIPGYIHSNYIDKDCNWVEMFICFSAGFCNSLLEMGLIKPDYPCGFAGESRDIADSFIQIRRQLESCSESDIGAVLPNMLALRHQLTNHYYTQDKPQDIAMVSLACQLLTEDLTERVDLREMCYQQGWGYEKFRKVFRQQTGVSPAQYRIRRRIDKSRQLLLTRRELSLQSISEQLGYSSVYEFSAQFKKITGQAPGKFRSR